MTEISYYWDGTSTGDASAAPYTALLFHSLWRKIFLKDRTIEGVICGYENALEVEGISGGVRISTGAALVDGMFYENDSPISLSVPTPSSSTRIDVIALRRNIVDQTIRVTRIAGVEGGSAPLLTQVDSGTWDLKLAEASITTGGVITVTDYRNCIRSSIFTNVRNWVLIEEIITEGGETSVLFENIPQIYTHLSIEIVGSYQDGASGSAGLGVEYNGDATLTNYNEEVIAQNDPALQAIGFNNAGLVPWAFPCPASLPSGYQGSGIALIPYYSDTNFFKVAFSKKAEVDSIYNESETNLWENTSAITQIELTVAATYTFAPNGRFRLYGLE